MGRTAQGESRKPRVVIFGAGRVGRALGRALRQCGWRIGAVCTLSPRTARAAARAIGGGTPVTHLCDAMLDGDVILITTPDREIESAAGLLALWAASHQPPRGKVVLHASGSLSADALRALARLGAATGSLHPFQTFGRRKTPDFAGLLFTIEGAPRAKRMARRIVRELGGVAVEIAPSAKAAYHAAGSFVAAHILSLTEAATRALTRLGFPRRLAQRALLRMARETLVSLEQIGPRATWTGPVSRGDYSTVTKHFAALAKFPPEYRAAHAALLRLSARVLAANPPAVLRALDVAIQEAEGRKRDRRNRG